LTPETNESAHPEAGLGPEQQVGGDEIQEWVERR
jgi:hypothetical protein